MPQMSVPDPVFLDVKITCSTRILNWNIVIYVERKRDMIEFYVRIF